MQATITVYHLHATDGEIGHVEDFMVDDENWAIRFLVVATRNWLPGKKVIYHPDGSSVCNGPISLFTLTSRGSPWKIVSSSILPNPSAGITKRFF